MFGLNQSFASLNARLVGWAKRNLSGVLTGLIEIVGTMLMQVFIHLSATRRWAVWGIYNFVTPGVAEVWWQIESNVQADIAEVMGWAQCPQCKRAIYLGHAHHLCNWDLGRFVIKSGVTTTCRECHEEVGYGIRCAQCEAELPLAALITRGIKTGVVTYRDDVPAAERYATAEWDFDAIAVARLTHLMKRALQKRIMVRWAVSKVVKWSGKNSTRCLGDVAWRLQDDLMKATGWPVCGYCQWAVEPDKPHLWCDWKLGHLIVPEDYDEEEGCPPPYHTHEELAGLLADGRAYYRSTQLPEGEALNR